MLVAVFAGCTKPVDPSEASPFSVYRIKDGLRFSLGDKRDDIEELVDVIKEDEDTVVIINEFEEAGEEDVFERVNYGDIEFYYNRAGNVIGLRAHENNWKIANGLKVTDSTEDVKKNYPKEYMYTYRQNNDIYISYDENGEMIEFSEKSPYSIRFAIENHAVKSIVIQKYIQ